MRIHLSASPGLWGEPTFEATFKAEIERLRHEELPLQQGLSLSSSVSQEPFRLIIIGKEGEEAVLRVKAGVFYSGIIAGCSCSDDPTPTDLQQEYCELLFEIDRASGDTTVTLLTD